MGKFIDETGKIYGHLQVLERGENNKQNRPRWKCLCLKCNKNIVEVEGTRLRRGDATQCKECGYKKMSSNKNAKFYNDILNKNFGHLHVIKRDEESGGSGNNVKWICKCDCGNIISVSTFCLTTRKQRTCGDPNCEYRNNVLSNSKTEDLSGMVFGELTVLYRSKDAENLHSDKNRSSYWHCRCNCGNELDASRTSLINGKRQCCDFCLKGKSLGEKYIEKILLDNNIKFQPEFSIPDLRGVNNGHVRFDFAIYKDDKLIRLIEFDGELHYVSIDVWNSETVKQNDLIKNEYCIKNNIPLVRIPYWERENIDLDMIMGDNFLIQAS